MTSIVLDKSYFKECLVFSYLQFLLNKAIGNKSDKFLEERKYFLERFLKISWRINYVIKSEEFKIFSRPIGEVDKLLDQLPAITPEYIFERLTTELELKMEEDENIILSNRAKIQSYSEFIIKILPILKSIRDKIKPMIAVRDTENANFQNMIFLMSKFEDGAMIHYADSNPTKLVVGKTLSTLYIETADDIVDKLKNPYTEFYYWVKGEIYDIQALNDCIEGRNRMSNLKDKAESK